MLKELHDKQIEIFPENIYDAISEKKEFYLQFAFFNNAAEALFLKLIRRFLASYDLLYLKDVLYTITKELITNAVKANAKRLYFKLEELDINNKSDYIKGMNTFKQDVISNERNFFSKLINTNLRVRILFRQENERLQLKIINNIPIVDEEIRKINARIKKAYKYNDITEAFDDVLDDSEGAGLGLIMSLMVFKNAGFAPNDFKVLSDGKKTITRIYIPIREELTETQVKITDKISQEVDALPSFPENIRVIEQLCNNDDSTINEIAVHIKKDPGLASSILKLANSAGYVTINRIKSIEDAVKIIGLQGIKTLVIASVVEDIINNRYKEFRKIWEESYKKAFYAQKISIQLRNIALTDPAYLSALLSEIGKIILLSVKQKDVESLIKIAGIKQLSNTDLLQEITLGISQTTLGAIVSEKWQFDEVLIKTIQYHLRPYIAPPKYKELIYIVHLAHVFTEMEKKKYKFEVVDDDVLDFFKIDNKQTFNQLHNTLKEAYKSIPPFIKNN